MRFEWSGGEREMCRMFPRLQRGGQLQCSVADMATRASGECSTQSWLGSCVDENRRMGGLDYASGSWNRV